MRKYLMILASLFISWQASISTPFAQWNTVEVDTVTRVLAEYMTFHQSLAIDGKGNAYAVWLRRDRNIRRDWIEFSTKPKGGAWSEPIVIADTFRVAVMVVDPHTGVQHIFVRDRDNEFRISRLHYIKKSELGTETELIARDSLRVSPHSVFMDQSGYLHLSWATEISPALFRIAYLTNESGQWQKELVNASDPGRFGAGSDPQIALTPSHDVVIVYVNNSYGGANVFLAVKRDQQAWQMDYVPFSGNDFGERLVDLTSDSTSGLHFVVSGWEGEDFFGKSFYFLWTPQTAWQGPRELPQSLGPGLVSIHVDCFGNPHIIWESNSLFFPFGKIFYSYKDKMDMWLSQQIVDRNEQGGSMYPSFILDFEGRGHLLLSYFVNKRYDSVYVVYLTSQNLITEVESEKPEDNIPKAFAFIKNYPNPFGIATTIRYELNASGTVALEVFNLIGELVVRYSRGVQYPGEYTFTWNGKDLFGKEVSNGLYLLRFQFASSQGRNSIIRVGKVLKLK